MIPTFTFTITPSDFTVFCVRFCEFRSCGEGTVLRVLSKSAGIEVHGVRVMKQGSKRAFRLVCDDIVTITAERRNIRGYMKVTRQRLFLMLEHIIKYGDALPQDLEFIKTNTQLRGMQPDFPKYTKVQPLYEDLIVVAEQLVHIPQIAHTKQLALPQEPPFTPLKGMARKEYLPKLLDIKKHNALTASICRDAVNDIASRAAMASALLVAHIDMCAANEAAIDALITDAQRAAEDDGEDNAT